MTRSINGVFLTTGIESRQKWLVPWVDGENQECFDGHGGGPENAEKKTSANSASLRQIHASASSMISRTASGERFFSTKSRWHSKTSFSASKRFALASASVSPCEIAAGISSTKHVYPPSFAGSKTAVSFIFEDYHTPASAQTRLSGLLPARVWLRQMVVTLGIAMSRMTSFEFRHSDFEI